MASKRRRLVESRDRTKGECLCEKRKLKRKKAEVRREKIWVQFVTVREKGHKVLIEMEGGT
jgi:hypothetical protein